MNQKLITLLALPVLILSSTPSAFAVVACPKGTKPYTLRPLDTCNRLIAAKKFNFKTIASIENINKKLSGFTCGNAMQGQIICYPLAQNLTPISPSNIQQLSATLRSESKASSRF